MKAVIYARYSSSHQKETSIEDQVRICRERAEKEGWVISEYYKDSAISGASLLLRGGMQKLLQDAMARKFDVVIAEALDRLSRDQADIANLFKQLQFHGIKLITLAEGEVDELHVGLKGTMNALFLKDLANKTRRGLRGRIEAGKSGGGISYGYDVVKAFASDGTPIKGDRTIDWDKAKIIKRIFKEYSVGRSPKAIAISLNKEGIVGPSGKEWGPSSINGNRERGTGIINNELYIGRLVWNRLTYLKNPNTGRRNSRLNPKSEWIIKEVPDLRIVGQKLWDKAKTRQGSLDNLRAYNQKSSFGRKRRPIYLFSGLTKCSCCGGGYSKISKDLLGCYNARNKETCNNRQNIRQDE
jgi:DNA invertase Pin-like site-specific DNA recombinase